MKIMILRWFCCFVLTLFVSQLVSSETFPTKRLTPHFTGEDLQLHGEVIL
jgi:hypothetical protein